MRKPEDFTLLIVDDEAGIRKNLEKHFSLDGYNILSASNGNEAIDLINKYDIHFIISDLRMPGGDGEELLSEVRRLHPSLPVIVMVTGYSELTKDEAIKRGALDLIAKPIDLKLLENYVEEAFNSEHW